jgi:hypothetical protein
MDFLHPLIGGFSLIQLGGICRVTALYADIVTIFDKVNVPKLIESMIQ